jgi:formamidopyrimidine-DNA glycosylase
MTGGWVHRRSGAPKERSERARLDVIRGGRSSSVRYLDSRRFGRLVVAREDIAEWRALGPDPLVDGIRSRFLADALGRSRRTVKDALMDQSLLAGIGNIWVTEALWRARIDPRSRSNALSHGDVTEIARGLRAELEHELAQRENEEWDDAFSVYGRGGQPCPRCQSPLVRIVLGGRTTTFCEGCQIHRR